MKGFVEVHGIEFLSEPEKAELTEEQQIDNFLDDLSDKRNHHVHMDKYMYANYGEQDWGEE